MDTLKRGLAVVWRYVFFTISIPRSSPCPVTEVPCLSPLHHIFAMKAPSTPGETRVLQRHDSVGPVHSRQRHDKLPPV
ncbi:hypothetical protein PsorP6_007414 [Peronosclerospora sorghi]|uniref:Uncharacterized protein n=1 Tax=Peronosclerospora sorghi TaxID=230839 RepID=A0ACC0W7D9_9STRA|nr:hypothetical protein PsorP6_007414 [Peronosclerospora sorghi]